MKEKEAITMTQSPAAQKRFETLGLTLPPAPKPIGAYKPFLRVGQHVYVSGHLPMLSDGSLMRGRVGADLDADGAFCDWGLTQGGGSDWLERGYATARIFRHPTESLTYR